MAQKIRCPHCKQEADLLHTRPVWIIGRVREIHDEQGNTVETEHDAETYMDPTEYEDYFTCGECLEELSRYSVLSQVFPNSVVQREA